jgi:hypothetical protein
MSMIAAQPVSARRLTLVPLAAGHADEMAAVQAAGQAWGRSRNHRIFSGPEPIVDPGLSAPLGTAEQACPGDENQDQPYAHQDG